MKNAICVGAGYKLDRTNYHSLLAVGRKQSFQYTQKVFEMMKADGLLDTLSCNLLIFSAARIKRFDAAWECYEQMLKDGSTKPDHVTLSGLLYAKGMAFGLEKAFEFLNTLKQVYSRDWRGEWDRGSDSGGPFCRITASAPTCLSLTCF
jgi:pentatricopeptide repeat protein